MDQTGQKSSNPKPTTATTKQKKWRERKKNTKANY